MLSKEHYKNLLFFLEFLFKKHKKNLKTLVINDFQIKLIENIELMASQIVNQSQNKWSTYTFGVEGVTQDHRQVS